MRKKSVLLGAGAAAAVVLLLGSAAYACTNHTGYTWICPTSTLCAEPGKTATQTLTNGRLWEQIGDGARANKTFTLKYTTGLNAMSACNSSALTNGTVVTNGSGVGSGQWTSALGAGDYTFCPMYDSLNATNHRNLTLT